MPNVTFLDSLNHQKIIDSLVFSSVESNIGSKWINLTQSNLLDKSDPNFAIIGKINLVLVKYLACPMSHDLILAVTLNF